MQRDQQVCEAYQLELAGLDAGESLSNDAALHLNSCAECQEIAELLSSNALGLRVLREAVIPAPMEAVPVPVKVVTMPARPVRWRWAVLATAAALIAAVGLWQFDADPRGESVEVASVQVTQPEVATPVDLPQPTPVASGNVTDRDTIRGVPERIDRVERLTQLEPPEREEIVWVEQAPLTAFEFPASPLGEFPDNGFGFDELAGSQEPAPQQTLVKILTPNPDVVIYWIVDNAPAGGSGAALEGSTNNL